MAQSIEPEGSFVEDSIRIGEPVHYSLSIKYPRDWQVVFPDSTFEYLPFEFENKSYFETKTDSTYAYDSAVYTLTSFEIDAYQALNLPIYVVNGKDSIEILSGADSIVFNDAVLVVPDSLKLKGNFQFQTVERAFNYPYFLIGLGVLLLILTVTFIMFGGKLRSRLRLYRLRKDYEKFVVNFQKSLRKIKSDQNNKKLIESILLEWKTYMEKLENRPFTKYTSKEIIQAGYEKELKEVLNKIDQSIYGKLSIDDMYDNFKSLNQFTKDRFEIRKEEVING